MQRVKVADIEVTKGKGDKGDWTKTTVVGEDGSRFSGFDTKLTNLTKGSVVDIEPEIKGKFTNIKEWKMISEVATGQPIVVSPGVKQYGKSPEELEQSLLAMCLAYAKDLAIADKIKVEDILTKADEFHDWVCSKKKPKAEKAKPAPKKSESKAEEAGKEWEDLSKDGKEPEIKNLGDLFTAAYLKYNMSQKEVIAEAGVSTKEEIADLQQVWASIKAVREK